MIGVDQPQVGGWAGTGPRARAARPHWRCQDWPRSLKQRTGVRIKLFIMCAIMPSW